MNIFQTPSVEMSKRNASFLKVVPRSCSPRSAPFSNIISGSKLEQQQADQSYAITSICVDNKYR